MSEPITVFLLDNHEIVRRGLRDPLESDEDFSVIGEASTQDQAVGQVHALDPDVVAVGGIRNPDPPDVEVDRVVVVARDPMAAAQNARPTAQPLPQPRKLLRHEASVARTR